MGLAADQNAACLLLAEHGVGAAIAHDDVVAATAGQHADRCRRGDE